MTTELQDDGHSAAMARLDLYRYATRNGCIEWCAGRDEDGYGIISVWVPDMRKTRTFRAHRLAWEEHHGRRLGPGELVRHDCDNPPCVNPDHLKVGTTFDNVADRVRRNHTARGEASGKSRFTVNDVLVIKAELANGISCLTISRRLGCSLSAIEHIRYGRCWSWLQAPPN